MNQTTPGFRPIDRSEHELLIVDDDPASRYATARLLRNAGFRTREAATGAEALMVANQTISAVVLDVHLPDIDGFELCRLLRSQPETNRLPVLHLTAAYVSDDDKVRGLDAGADAYLTHPVEPAVLVATVQALVRTRVAEDAMRRSEAKFRAIYEQAPSGIGLLDEQGRFIDANPAMLALIDRAADAVVGRPLSSFVPPEWVEQVNACTREVGHVPVCREFPMLAPDGRRITLEWRISAHIEPHVSMAVATDISERLLIEQQRQQLLDRERVARGEAEQVSRMKDDFIAVLSHELRAPLNAIMGWTHVLQKRGGSEETLRGLAAIERNGHMQARMIADLLDMSRLNLGKLPLSLETLDPAEAIIAALNAMRPSIDENNNELLVDIAPPYRAIRVDGSRLQQIVWNLLSNAIKFSPRGGKIRIALTEENAGLHIRISDEGQGIAPDFLPLVFDRFSQSTGGSNRRRGGLGLGLSIVKQLVEAHGGSVSVESAGVGQGASFDIWLPADSAADEAGESMCEETAPGELDALEATGMLLAGARLLVVEDDPDARTMLQIILSDRGAAVRSAASCDEALALLADMQPDLLVSDIGMPGKDGYDLIRELRRREAAASTPRLPAIALTSFTRTQDQEQALAAGFDAHCAKPLRPLKLVRQIETLLEQRGIRSAR
jgi:PAS domain S-box-containing protein